MSDKLDQIDDLLELCEIMKFFHIPTKGLKHSDDFKTKIREHLERSSTRKVGEVSTHFSKCLDGWIH